MYVGRNGVFVGWRSICQVRGYVRGGECMSRGVYWGIGAYVVGVCRGVGWVGVALVWEGGGLYFFGWSILKFEKGGIF